MFAMKYCEMLRVCRNDNVGCQWSRGHCIALGCSMGNVNTGGHCLHPVLGTRIINATVSLKQA